MQTRRQSADEMVQIVMRDPGRLDALKDNPLPELEKLRAEAVAAAGPIYTGDPWIYRVVVGVLGLVALTATVGAIVLVGVGKTTPEALVALGSASVGALAGLLAPSPTGG